MAEGRHVIFDLSHLEGRFSDPLDYTTPSGWGPAMDLLVANGFTWSTIPADGHITPAALASASLLIVAEPLTSFAPDEVDAVLDYVREGGGLMLLNDFNAPINDLAVPTGVTFLLSPNFGFVTGTDLDQTHPVMAGIDEIDLPIVTALLVGNQATPVAYYLGQPVIAVQEYFAGRILYVGDNELFSGYGIHDLDNAAFFLNSLTWLSNDSDGDGVGDGEDSCPNTTPGDNVDRHGCSFDQILAEGCPVDRNYCTHGAYVSCVVHVANDAYEDRLISKQEWWEAVTTAAHSDIGKNSDCN
jgi:hypothetical protein